MEAMIKAEVIKNKFKQSYYGGWGIEIANNLFNENLYYTCKLHKEKVDQLKKDRLFNNFLKIRDTLKSEVFSYLSCNLPIDSNTVHVLNIEFNLKSSQIKISQSLVKASTYFNVSDDLDTFGHVKLLIIKE
ncbi:MAG: hypothetical protein IPO62_12945 [Saprospiraceae bacterium]|nr:hypothetical protein [Saprospiraceae bacterium]